LSLSKLAQREPLTITDPSDPLTKSVELSGRDYGIYFAIEPRKGKTVLAFRNGKPFLSKEGNVTHVAIGIGNQLEASSVFYDKFLVRMIADGSPAVSSGLDEREKQLTEEKESQDQKIVRETLATAGIQDKSGQLFRLGMSEENIGRFGWQLGKSMLTAV